MSNTYCVIDLSRLYNNLEPNMLYLDLGLRFDNENLVERRIHIASKRYLNVLYDKNKIPRLVLKNRVTGAYDFIPIPMKGTSYALYSILDKKGIEVSVLEYGQWIDIKSNIIYEKEEMNIYDSATVLEGYDGNQYSKTIIVTEAKYKDIDFSLKKITCCDWRPIGEIELFNKCVQNEQISISDIYKLVESSYDVLCMEFGNLIIHFESRMITVYKKFSIHAEGNEVFMFRMKQERMPDLAIFLDFVLKAETDNNLVEGINKYFIF